MGRYFVKTLICDEVDECVLCASEALKHEGFSVVSQADLSNELGCAFGIDRKGCRLLIICHPNMAQELLALSCTLCTSVFCVVYIYETKDGFFEVAVADPIVDGLSDQASESYLLLDRLRSKLKRAIDQL